MNTTLFDRGGQSKIDYWSISLYNKIVRKLFHGNTVRPIQYKTPTYYFIHIPKNAGTSIQRLIYSTKDLPLVYVGHNYPTSRTNEIVVLRDPIDRFVSAFTYMKQYHFRNNAVDFQVIKTANDLAESLYTGDDRFPHALAILKQQHRQFQSIKGKRIHTNWVFAPQYLYVHEPAYILHFENLNQEFKQCMQDIGYTKEINLPMKNTSTNSKKQYLSKTALKFIHMYYKDDFELVKNAAYTYSL